MVLHRRRSQDSRKSAEKSKTVTEMIDEEIANLHPQLANQAVRCKEALAALRVAQAAELQESKELNACRDEARARRDRLTARMQACVRGWLVRRQFVDVVNREFKNQVGLAAVLPDQLRDQLRHVQHSIHDLKYRRTDRRNAALRVQSWWRSIHARRIAMILRVAHRMHKLHMTMVNAAIKLQSRYRAYSAYRRFYLPIRQRMEFTHAEHLKKMEQGLVCVVRIQRAMRAKLARRKMCKAREQMRDLITSKVDADGGFLNLDGQSSQTSCLGLVDQWAPLQAGSASGRVIISEVSALPKPDQELHKLENSGLTPFYGSSHQELLRHRIGGPAAVQVHQLMSATYLAQTCGVGCNLQLLEDARFPDELWNVYPEGVSHRFLEQLDEDAWAQRTVVQPCRADRRSSSRRRGGAGGRNARCTRVPSGKPAQSPPNNAARRARAREDAHTTKPTAPDLAHHHIIEFGQELHPLLIGTPFLSSTPVPPPGAPPHKQCSLRVSRHRSVNMDCTGSWEGATGFT